jgi:hypothetical protein
MIAPGSHQLMLAPEIKAAALQQTAGAANTRQGGCAFSFPEGVDIAAGAAYKARVFPRPVEGSGPGAVHNKGPAGTGITQL